MIVTGRWGTAARDLAARSSRLRVGGGEDVVGQVEIALQDLAGGADQRRLRDGDLASPVATELDLHVDAALRVQHGDVVRPGAALGCRALATVPGRAKAVATPMAPVAACEAWHRRGVK